MIFRQPWSRSHLIGYLQYFCHPSSIPSQVGLTLLFQIPHPCLVFLCHTKHRISHTKLRVPLSLVSRSQDPFLYIFSRLLPISISDVLQLLADRIWHFTVWAMWVLKFYTKHRGKRGREDDGVGCKGGLYLRVFNPPRYSHGDNAVKVLIP